MFRRGRQGAGWLLSVVALLGFGCNQPRLGWRSPPDETAGSRPSEGADAAQAGGAGEGQRNPAHDAGESSGGGLAEPGPAAEGSAAAMEADPAPARSATHVSYRERLRQGAIGADMLVVNGEVITVQDVLDPIKPGLERAAETMSVEQYRVHVQEVVAAQVWRQINERLVYEEALSRLDERLTSVLDAEADRVLRERVNAEFDGRQSRFERHLAELGKSISDVREQTRRRLLVADYLRKKFESQVPESTRPELWRYYVRHAEEFTEPARTELFLIDVPYEAFLSDPASRPGSGDWLSSKDRARRQIEAALAALDSGAPFDQVAEEYSRGIHAADGGAWGVIGSSGLVGRYAPVTEALAGMDSNQHSGAIEAEDAYFIVGTGHVRRARLQPFEEAQERIKMILRQQRFEELEREYLEQLRSRANVQRWREFQLEVIRAIPPPR